jgi:hypothetical protein
MKAFFKLTLAQIEAIKAIPVPEYEEGYHIDCGMYVLQDHCAVNPEQRVVIDWDDRPGHTTLAVEGHRCALDQDGGFRIAESIVGKDAVPFRYETSDKRLKWNETLGGYMMTRATLHERIMYVLNNDRVWEYYLPEYVPIVRALKTNERLASAQYTAEELRVGRRLIAQEHTYR